MSVDLVNLNRPLSYCRNFDRCRTLQPLHPHDAYAAPNQGGAPPTGRHHRMRRVLACIPTNPSKYVQFVLHTNTHLPFALLHIHTVLPPCACTPCLPPFTPGPHAHERRAPSLPTFPPPRAPGPLSFYFKYHNSALESSQLNAWPLVASDHIGWFDCFPAFEVGPGADCVFARLGSSNR